MVNDLLIRFTEMGIETFLIAARMKKGQSANLYFEPLHPMVKIYQNNFVNPLDSIHRPAIFIVSLFQYLRAALQLCFFLHRHKIQIIHLHFVSFDIFLLVLFKYFFRYKLMITFTGSDLEKARISKLARLKVKLALKYADSVTAVSEDLCNKLRDTFPFSKPVYVPNGIDPDKIRQSAGSCLPQISEDHFVYCGRLIAVKRVSFLIDAFFKCLTQGCAKNLYIVGDGEEASRIEELIRSYDIQDRVITVGALSHPEVLSIINRSRCLLLSSSSEGCPMVALESFALAKPVIAPDVGGLREVVVHGENGYLYPADRQDLLCELIMMMSENESLSAHIGSKGTAVISGKFAFNSVVDQYLKIYDSLNQGIR